MQLGQLARERDAAITAEGFREVAQGGAQLVRRLVKDHGALFVLQRVQMLAPRLFVDGQESLEAPAPGRQAGGRERAHRGAAARDGDDRHIMLRAQRDQILARVGNRGRARVRHERAAFAREQLGEHLLAARAAVVLVVGDHGLAGQAARGQQLLRDAGVLCGDEIHRGQHLTRAGRQVAEVADRRGDQIQNRITHCNIFL